MDTYCDMSHLLSRESWGDQGAVAAIGYFCGVLGHREGETAEEASVRVRAGRRLPSSSATYRAVARAGGDGSEPPFEWDLVADAEEGGGPSALDPNTGKANLSGSERYV